VADGKASMTLEQEIAQQVRDEIIILDKLSKEDKRMSGEVIGPFGYEYDTGLMFNQILERNYDKWLRELTAIDDIAEQDTYYRTVIYPHIQYLEWRVNDRHTDKRDGRELEKLKLYDDALDDLTDVVYRTSPGFLHELVTDPTLCRIIKRLTPDQKEVIYNSAVLEFSIQDMSVIKKTTDRNILKTKETALRHIRGQFLPVVMFKHKIQTKEKYRWLFVRGVSTTFEERGFAANIGAEYTDYYPDYVVDEKTKKDTLRYIEYYNKHVMDFVEITRDYRAQAQRIKDNTARLEDEKRRFKELMEKKKELQNQLDDGNMIGDAYSYDGHEDNIYYDDYSYDVGDDDDAQDI